MKVLVIGGTGLISTAITRFLIERGDELTLYNRGKTDADVPEGYRLITGDRKDYGAFEAQMAEAGPFDTVIDMIGFVPAEVESDVRAFRGRVGQFIFCSTVDVYTKPATCYPVREEEERQPVASFPYAFNKAKCERILEQAHERGDFPVTIIRPAYTYGEGRGLLHSFRGGMYYLDRIRRGKPIITHGDGSSLWASCHRDDVARAFVEATGNERAYGKSYHTAGEEVMTWNQYHQGVASAIGAPEPKLVHIPTELLFMAAPKQAEWCKENFQFNNIFDNIAAKTELNFRQTISWREGVQRVVAWLDIRNGIHDRDEPAVYGAIIEAWKRLGTELKGVIGG